jgi:hypothetical protein
MAGTSALVCRGFIESDSFAHSKERLKQLMEWPIVTSMIGWRP